MDEPTGTYAVTLVVSSGLRRRLFFAGSADQDGRDAIERVVARAAQMQHEYDDLEEAAVLSGRTPRSSDWRELHID